MAECGGGKDLDYGDRKRKEMLDRIEGRKRRGVVSVHPVDMEVEGEVVPVSVPVAGEVQQPSASPSPTLDVHPRPAVHLTSAAASSWSFPRQF